MNAHPFRKSQRLEGIQLSEIVRLSEASRQRRAEGADVIALSTGEPDFPTPEHVVEAAYAAMKQGQTNYPPTAGTSELRNQICHTASRAGESSFSPDPANVIVSTGAKQVISNAFLASLNAGDEVIIPAPYWTSYPDMVALAGGLSVSVVCSAEQDFKLKPQQLLEAITPATRWLMLNSPSNPSGAMYSSAELEALAEVLRAHPHVWILTDEIYQHIAYREFSSFLQAAPDLSDRTLLVNGVSKAYSMTGWRIGWGIGPKALISAMISVQGQTTSGACSISQAAAVAALQGPQAILAERCEQFKARRDLVVDCLNKSSHICCPTPDGAFYVFPSCEEALGLSTPSGQTLQTDADFCLYLLESEDVTVVPGRAFGLPGHFRMSYAYSEPELEEGCRRISRAVNTLK
jgi:aspartate aminotransferase